MVSDLVVWRGARQASHPEEFFARGTVQSGQFYHEAELERLERDAEQMGQLGEAFRRGNPGTRLLPPPTLPMPAAPRSQILAGMRAAHGHDSDRTAPLALQDLLTKPLCAPHLAQTSSIVLDRLLTHAIEAHFSGLDDGIPLLFRPLGLATLELQRRAEQQLNRPAQSFLMRLSSQNLLEEAEEERLAARGSSEYTLWPSEDVRQQWHDYRRNLCVVLAGRDAKESSPQPVMGAWWQFSLLLWVPLTLISCVRLFQGDLRR